MKAYSMCSFASGFFHSTLHQQASSGARVCGGDSFIYSGGRSILSSEYTSLHLSMVLSVGRECFLVETRRLEAISAKEEAEGQDEAPRLLGFVQTSFNRSRIGQLLLSQGLVCPKAEGSSPD